MLALKPGNRVTMAIECELSLRGVKAMQNNEILSQLSDAAKVQWKSLSPDYVNKVRYAAYLIAKAKLKYTATGSITPADDNEVKALIAAIDAAAKFESSSLVNTVAGILVKAIV